MVKKYPNNTIYKVEYVFLFLIILCYLIGNFAFYLLNFYPNNTILHAIIWDGYELWREEITMPVAAVIFLIYASYLYFTKPIENTNKTN
jgi:hypothetical protein